MNLEIKRVTKDNFVKYGQLISTNNLSPNKINNNTTESFYDLVDIEILGNDKDIRVNIFNPETNSI